LFEAGRRRFVSFHAKGGSRSEQAHLPLVDALCQFHSRAAGYAHDLFLGKCAYSARNSQSCRQVTRSGYS